MAKTLGRFIFRRAVAEEVRAISPRFRRVTLRGEGLRQSGWMPGDKVQVFLPDIGMRTYTPLAWNEAHGITELLVYSHGDGPGSRWGQTLAAGQPYQFIGPRRSLVLGAGERILLFGDETSFAVAHALTNSKKMMSHPTGAVRAIFEVSDRSESEKALVQMNLDARICIAREAADAHLVVAFAQMRAALAEQPDTRVVLTGRAQSIQGIRALFKRHGVQLSSTVKAYWSVGKRGLD